MRCREFVEGYSEFRDDRLRPERERRYRTHLRACPSCARYDRVVTRGVEVFNELPTPSPSDDFFPRLKHRIYHVQDGIPMSTDWPAGSAALVAVATVGLLALSWLPFAARASVEVQLPAVAAERPEGGSPAPAAEVSLFRSGPFVAPAVSAASGVEGAGRGWQWAPRGRSAIGPAGDGVAVLPAAGRLR